MQQQAAKMFDLVDAINLGSYLLLMALVSAVQSASGKGAALVDTVASAVRLSLFFGEDTVLKNQGLEQS